MKKIILKSMLVIMLLGTATTTTNAVSGNWIGSSTGSKIEGAMYLTNGYSDKANAKTRNLSANGHKAYLQMYCYQKNGVVDSNSVRVGVDNAERYLATGVSSTKNPGIWESLHSTAGTKDPYYGLRIKI